MPFFNLFGRNKRPGVRNVFLVLFLFLMVFFSTSVPRPANAQMNIIASIPQAITDLKNGIMDFLGKVLRKTGSSLLQNMVRNSVNTLAYEAATQVGSGLSGQKEMFETKAWTDILKDTRDASVGGFIDSLSDAWGVNLCEPSLSVKQSIGLGLKQQAAPKKPNCDWQKLDENWNLEKIKKDFLKNSAITFEPTNNNTGQAFYAITKMFDKSQKEEVTKRAEMVSKNGWLDVRNIGGEAETYPGKAQVELDKGNQAYWDSMQKVTGDIFVDAANTFLNQLALTTYKGLMDKLAKKDGSGSLTSANSDPNSNSGGEAGLRKRLAKMVEPTFNSRGDYDILGELSSCDSSMASVGPTNCVINDSFRNAIAQKKTVGQALTEGLLPKDAPFGFQTSGASAIEPNYLEGIPYRSMIILRKFRIIPVGWELAAQYIRSNPNVGANAYLGKMVECFSNTDSYVGYDEDWCRGLVDPDWVLKAPQNYCAKQGYGPQIIFQQAVAQGVDVLMYDDKNGNKTFDSGDVLNENGTSTVKVNNPSKLVVNRLDTYCADEQSCIKEKDDGSCQYYGYCTEERRKWNFGANSCEPVYNSCQTFKAEAGETSSFLKNTLSFCSEENFGCERYAKAATSSYVLATNKNDWKENDGYSFFNKNAQTCESDSEGCHEFLRFRSGLGTNLIRNSGFEQNEAGDTADSSGIIGNPSEVSLILPVSTAEKSWMTRGSGASISDEAPGRGGKVLMIDSASSPAGLYSQDRSLNTYSILPQGFVMEPETSYVLSADIYNVSADKVVLQIGRDGQYWQEKEIIFKNSWTREKVVIKNNKDILANEIRIFGYGSSGVQFYIDNVQFEVGSKATAYNEYRQKNLVYEKLLPKYLEEVCYVDWKTANYQLKSDAPAVCRQYARKCSRDEANCEMYSSASGANIPAAVTDKDYCTSECNGFDAYIQSKNNFNSLRTFYFIPKTAKQCSAAEVGCEEFTNLDKSAQGGESREYYSYLRQCVKPNTTGNTCASFYTWEGNNEQGEQLSVHSLKAETSGDVSLTSNDSSECSEAIFNLPATDPHYNPDCRRFTNQAGVLTYHLYSRTISCTDDCHPYRLSNKNVAERAVSQSACIYGSNGTGTWDSVANLCYYCENGGYWSSEHNSCIYNATPKESVACSSGSNGCSEFNGNQGNNVKQLFFSTFENGGDGWSTGRTAQTNSTAISGKQSLFFYVNVSKPVGDLLSKNGSYTLSFVARSSTESPALITAAFVNSSATADFRANASSSVAVEVKPNEWGVYQLNLASLNHEPADDERLILYSDGQVYIDNIKLSVIAERYYLIRNSWVTPDSCNQDENGKAYPLYMLGCSEYKDRFGSVHYLHRFSHLCQESAVGCEAMVDTQNSTKQSSEYYWTGGNTVINPDRVTYAVYDQAKTCQSLSKGCERYGLAKEYENSYIYTDSFIKNDPDKYGSILCEADGVGCDKWSSSDGDYYFKNPGDMVCEWRLGTVPGQSAAKWAWFKKKVKRCDGTGDICSANTDCVSKDCRLDDREVVCPTSQYKTFGLGGIGNEVYQPEPEAGFNWVGLCSADQSGCTEYVDPVSDFSTNLIYNFDFTQDIDKDLDNNADGWENASNPSSATGRQRVFLDGNNLYVLTVEGDNTASIDVSSPTATDFRPIYSLNSDNTLSDTGVNSIETIASSSVVFYVDKNAEGVIEVSNRKVNLNNSKISLKKVVIDYQINQKVDKKSCNGSANLSNGCIYFNERAIVGAQGYSTTTVNAWTGYSKNINVSSDTKNANGLIKVAADRVCNTWLSCKTYVNGEDNKPVCFDIAECDRLDQGGNCVNFPVLKDSELGNRTYDYKFGAGSQENFETIKNLSGYSKVGLDLTGKNGFTFLPNNLFNLGIMEQYGSEVKISNGNFEFNKKTLNGKEYVYTPGGWSPYASTLSPQDSSGMFDVIQDPVSAQKAGVSYPAEGAAFLRYNAANINASPFSDTIRITAGQKYYLSYRINTTGLISGEAKVEILRRGELDETRAIVETFTTQSSQDWLVRVHEFVSDVDLINIRLSATSGAGGYIYIDDVKISPVLKIKDSSNTYINQGCRLYPKEDSLSCDYIDEAGMRLKGDYGYCLEYDRAPGNPNTCLLWWPIDKVSGQGGGNAVKASTPYSGPAPLFYCVGAQTSQPYLLGSEVQYTEDEKLSVTINGNVVADQFSFSGSRDDQYGTLGQRGVGNIPLRFGENTIQLNFAADTGAGRTFLRFLGSYHYQTSNGASSIDATKNFDFVSMFKEWRALGGTHTVRKNLANGDSFQVNFSCGPNDGRVGVRTCNLGGYADGWPGDGGEFITNTEASNCTRNNLCDGGTNSMTLIYTFNIPYECLHVAQAVDRNGSNKSWVERIKESSGYEASCNTTAGMSTIAEGEVLYTGAEGKNVVLANSDGTCAYSADASPFGSVVSPGSDEFERSEPSTWGELNDGSSANDGNSANNKPLPYGNSNGGTNVSMGQLYSPSTLSYLFAESYGVWDWVASLGQYVINNNSSLSWSSPMTLCNNNVRSGGKFENCSIRPDIKNIKLNNATNATVFGRGFVNLSFNSKVDAQQAPLTFYEVDWGDAEKLTVSGVDMKDMPNEGTPHSAFHSYDYWDLYGKWTKARANEDFRKQVPALACFTKSGSYPQDYCLVKPKVKIKDNWGWCSEGRNLVPCPQPETAACINTSNNTEVSKAYCRNYSPALSSSIVRSMCDSAHPICSDGYWEASGDIVVYKY